MTADVKTQKNYINTADEVSFAVDPISRLVAIMHQNVIWFTFPVNLGFLYDLDIPKNKTLICYWPIYQFLFVS